MKTTTPALIALLLTQSLLQADPAAAPLYTREGSDPSFAELLQSEAFKAGERFQREARVTGSTIKVNHELLGKQIGTPGPIPEKISLHTEATSGISRKQFANWTRWYQEDGNIQIFRLFKGEQNIRGGSGENGSPGRVEAHTPAIILKDGQWSEWQGTYTIVHPVQANIFQLMHEGGQLWPFHIRMTDEGDVYFARRRPIEGLPDKIVLGEKMTGKSICIKVRANGRDYEVFSREPLGGQEWKFVTKGNYVPAEGGKISFRWGMYCGSKKGESIRKDALLFVSGVVVR
ncbi:MAG TPA: hypothetical protein VFY13_03050 [Luteolibacter sp.]|nr:hypothetical protein [Luteolibacter sp.]